METFDVAVRGSDDRLRLVVEVKARQDVGSDWARQFAGYVLADAEFPNDTFFLLVTSTKSYLWRTLAGAKSSPSDYVFDTNILLANYLNRVQTPLAKLPPESLTQLVTSWLREISLLGNEALSPNEVELRRSGLPDALKDGTVTIESAA